MLGDLLAKKLHIHLPGSIIGFFIVFILLILKIIQIEWLEIGASFLLANLLLLFVPSAVGIVQYEHLMESEGLRILFVIAISTVLVMTVTGFITDRLTRKKEERQTTRSC